MKETMIFDARGNGDGNVCYSIDMGGGKSSCVILDNKSPTLTCTHYGEPAVVYQK